MKNFITRLLFFLFPVLVISIGVEILLRNIPNDYAEKANYFKTHTNDIEVLILGSSHSFRGVNPKYFKNHAYNAAYVSQSLDYDKTILDQFFKDSNSLHTVILSVSYMSLFQKLSSTHS